MTSSQFGLLAQLVERCAGIAEIMGSNPVRTIIAKIAYIRFLTAVHIHDFHIFTVSILISRIRSLQHNCCGRNTS